MAKKPTLEQRLQGSPALLKKYLGNPGTRAKVPDKMLPANLLATRRANARRARENATTYNPVAQLSGNDLRSAVEDIVNGQTRPELDDLDRQRGVTEGQGRQLSDRAAAYYQNFQDRQNAALTALQGVDATALQGVKDANANAAGTVDAAAKSADDRLAQDAAVRGQTASAGREGLTASLAARRAGIAERGGADEKLTVGTNAAAERGQIGFAGAAGLKGGEALGDIAGRTQNALGEIAAKRREVVGARGPLRTDTLLKLRQAGFDNLITQGGLNLKAEDLEAQTATDAADRASRERHDHAMEGAAADRNATTRRGQDLSHKDRQDAINARTGKTADGLTASQLHAARQKASDRWSDFISAKETFKTLQRLAPGTPPDQLIIALQKRGVKDSLVLRTLTDWIQNRGRLSDGLVSEWKRQHFSVPNNRRTSTRSPVAANTQAYGKAPVQPQGHA